MLDAIENAFNGLTQLQTSYSCTCIFCKFSLGGYVFNYAFEIFKVPLAILALIFPAVALVASQHRSVQTAAQIAKSEKQISLTESKNNFENYIKHKEIFKSAFEEYLENKNYKVKNYNVFYKNIFPENGSKLFDQYVDFGSNCIKNLYLKLSSIEQFEATEKDYLKIVDIYFEIIEKCSLENSVSIEAPLKDLNFIKSNITEIIDIIRYLVDFSYTSDPSWAVNINDKKLILILSEMKKNIENKIKFDDLGKFKKTEYIFNILINEMKKQPDLYPYITEKKARKVFK